VVYKKYWRFMGPIILSDWKHSVQTNKFIILKELVQSVWSINVLSKLKISKELQFERM
jgi:hypothetical protein